LQSKSPLWRREAAVYQAIDRAGPLGALPPEATACICLKKGLSLGQLHSHYRTLTEALAHRL